MEVFSNALRLLSSAALGLFVGAMLTEGGVLVPYWQSLAAAEFLAWYKANDARLLAFFAPLTTIVALLVWATAIVSVWEGHAARWLAVVAALLMFAVVSMFFVYFEQANASFAAPTIRVDDVATELARWATWHWVRSALSCAALAAALLCCWRPS